MVELPREAQLIGFGGSDDVTIWPLRPSRFQAGPAAGQQGPEVPGRAADAGRGGGHPEPVRPARPVRYPEPGDAGPAVPPGLRIAEALALKPTSIDLVHHTARVLHGKGDKATVRPVHPSADDALARWMDTRKQFAAAHGWKNGPLFCTLAGGETSDQYVRNLLQRLPRRPGWTTRAPARTEAHLRGRAAQGRCRRGDDLQGVGHSDIATTARYLDHVTNGQAVDVVAASTAAAGGLKNASRADIYRLNLVPA